jgi:phage FluMu gp28-like protein
MEPRSHRTATDQPLLACQSAWIADESDVKVIEKSRRVGISWVQAADDALLAAANTGMDVFYIGYNKDMAREYIEDVAEWARFYSLAAGSIEEEEEIFRDGDSDKSILVFRIHFASGHKVEALSSRPTNIRGKQGRIVIDEAAYHDKLHELIKAALAMLMWGAQVVVISSHNGTENEFNELVEDIRTGRREFSLHRITLDDALAHGLFDRIRMRLEAMGKEWRKRGYTSDAAGFRDWLVNLYGDGADEELFCIPRRSEGAYLTRGMIEACMDKGVPVFRWERPNAFAQEEDAARYRDAAAWCAGQLLPALQAMPENFPTYFGEDFGRTGDLSVFMPAQEYDGMVHRCPFVVELRNIPFKQQEQILFFILDMLPEFRGGAMDARGNGAYLAEVTAQKYGDWRIHQVQLTQNWYIDHMPRLKAALEDRTFILPHDPDILDDFRAIRMVKGVAKVPEGHKNKGRDGKPRHGDAGIAGALCVYAVHNCHGGPMESTGTGIKRPHTRLKGYL